jgi:hypothetical protein
MNFEILSNITNIETIAIGNSIRELNRLIKYYGDGRWRKMKGIAWVKLTNEDILNAEIHWYEAHGIGRKEYKIKRILE